MRIQWSFEGCDNTIKSTAQKYWEKKQQRIERVLSRAPRGSLKMRLAIYYNDSQVNAIEARAIIHLPGRTLAVESTAPELYEALDGLTDKIVASCLNYKSKQSRFLRRRRKKQTSAELFEAQPLINSDRKAERKQSFFSTLRPLLSYLERRAKTEVRVFELEGTVAPGRIEPSELIDEVVLLAWEKYTEKPSNLSFELWLHQLLQEVLNRVAKEGQFVSLDQSIPLAELETTYEPDWFEEVIGYQEELSLAELLPDFDETEDWSTLDEEERIIHFYNVIESFPVHQRQAYMLNSISDYSVQEVAEIQKRSVGEVESDIRVSTQALQEYMIDAGMVKRK